MTGCPAMVNESLSLILNVLVAIEIPMGCTKGVIT